MKTDFKDAVVLVDQMLGDLQDDKSASIKQGLLKVREILITAQDDSVVDKEKLLSALIGLGRVASHLFRIFE